MNRESGFSIVELLLLVVIIGSAVFLLANIPNALMLINKSRHMSLAREIAVKQIEDKRAISYINIGLGVSSIDDSRLAMLPSGSGEVQVGAQNEETPEPDDWIPCDSTVCTNGEAIKQITVTVSWTDNNKPQTVTLSAIIGEGGINQ